MFQYAINRGSFVNEDFDKYYESTEYNSLWDYRWVIKQELFFFYLGAVILPIKIFEHSNPPQGFYPRQYLKFRV